MSPTARTTGSAPEKLTIISHILICHCKGDHVETFRVVLMPVTCLFVQKTA
jgi:hypothetical protein